MIYFLYILLSVLNEIFQIKSYQGIFFLTCIYLVNFSYNQILGNLKLFFPMFQFGWFSKTDWSHIAMSCQFGGWQFEPTPDLVHGLILVVQSS